MPETERVKLIQKLKNIYIAIDHIEKMGDNDKFKYKYVRAADVARAVRNAFVEQNIYAQPDFKVLRTYEFVTSSGTKMNGVDVECKLELHDIDSQEIITINGLGSGSDTTDKAVYKAQTGAIKYALRNAFLVPDESDPENEPGEPAPEPESPKKGYTGAKRGPKPRLNAITGDSRASVTEQVPSQQVPSVTPLESTKEEGSPDRPATPEELGNFHTRAKTISQKLVEAGLKGEGNEAATAKVAKFITKKAKAPVLSAVGFNMWSAILDKLEERVHSDPEGTVKLIDSTVKA